MPSGKMFLAMTLEGRGKLARPEGKRTLIYVSAKVASDSQFPFKPGDELLIRIDGKKLVVEKAKG